MSAQQSVLIFFDVNGFNNSSQPFTDFPRADNHELLLPDLLHQLVWINEYLVEEHGAVRGSEIIDDIDRRYSISSAFLLNQ
jgi:hypothetical protein